MKTLLRAPSGRRSQLRRASQAFGTAEEGHAMKPFGIEQFELEPFMDSGFGDVPAPTPATDLDLAAPCGVGTLKRRRERNRGFGADARVFGSEAGMATAEYAIATLAAVGLAGLLVVILRSEEVRGFLLNLIRTALSLP
ncbi:DUF4244 domain-containing protein [Paenarthrobacter sp. AR 02]|uniref:DUF4244 domain-containing protein n=1 Tax=Paenarthrobacter sp. AR 02 TaxID=2899821 RepID=UPI001F31D686|nr:DUF4244 domain-containing protein [Paenarthrobacter sp. AR 02]MCF3138105.1 DUF4244 domain-containing protein [Paenarthrobacter sp. AR 02]